MASLTTTDILRRIRFDPLTKKGSVYDVIQLVTGCGKEHTNRNWSTIVDNYPDVNQKVVNFKFPGQGQRPTPVAPTATLVEIAWLCPGRAAKEFRRQGAVTLCRALGGDLSLVEEIRARHAEVDQEEQEALLAGTGVTMAEANGQALVVMDEDDVQRRRAETRKLAAEAEEVEARAKMIKLDMHDRMRQMAEDATEARDRLMYLDAARNFFGATFGSTLLLTADSGRSPNAQITISTVATQMGVRLDRAQLQEAGKLASRLYRNRHGDAPPKHEQFCDGRVILANTYTEADRDLVETAVREAVESA